MSKKALSGREGGDSETMGMPYFISSATCTALPGHCTDRATAIVLDACSWGRYFLVSWLLCAIVNSPASDQRWRYCFTNKLFVPVYSDVVLAMPNEPY